MAQMVSHGVLIKERTRLPLPYLWDLHPCHFLFSGLFSTILGCLFVRNPCILYIVFHPSHPPEHFYHQIYQRCVQASSA